MTNEELKAAIEHTAKKCGVPYDKEATIVIEAARELSHLKDGTHPDMVMVPKEQWQYIETYDYQNFPEVWLAAWIEPSEYAKENGASSRWDIGMGRCWHVNTRKFTGVLGGAPMYWCKTNKPDAPAQKGTAK